MRKLLYVGIQKAFNSLRYECSKLWPITPLDYVPLSRSNTNMHRSYTEQRIIRETNAVAAQKKPKASPKISLLVRNESVTVTTLEDAQKLAKRRQLHLLQVQEFDTKTQRPVYRLATPAELISEGNEDLKSANDKSNENKSEKTLTIRSRISDNDLSSRLKNITKWLAKSHEVRVFIQGVSTDKSGCEKIFKTIDQSINNPCVIGKIVTKREKGNAIRFSIVPVKAAPADITDVPPA